MPEQTASLRPSILGGFRVLDLTRFLSGPQATLFLAGLGAEVIRIDEPGRGDPTMSAPPYVGPEGVSLRRQTPEDIGIAYLKRGRAKKAITLDLKKPKGLALFQRLVTKADIVVENFRAGVTKRLGIEYADLAQINPRIVHCCISGYGATGPQSRRKAYDLMIQAATGLMSITGDPEGPARKAGSPLSDGIAGTFAVTGILAALLQRERTGRGQFIDVAMADCLFALLFDEPLDCYERLGLPLRQGNRIMRFSPFNAYPTRDGAVAIGVATTEDWTALLKVIGRTDLMSDANFMDVGWRVANNAYVDAIVTQWTSERTRDEVLQQLDASDIACSPVRDASDLMAWPFLRERSMIEALRHPVWGECRDVKAPGFPLKFSGAASGYDQPAVLPAAHNREIYSGLLGLTDADLESLTRQNVI